ncbi:MAG: transcription antitermination factor NusB [Thermodesulfobacteriota bacterium]|nr:transcription antitermination factor NusB [Thermodesulfobacteriota bacterium]
MGERRKAREFALQFLYQSDIDKDKENIENSFNILRKYLEVKEEIGNFSWLLVKGVSDNKETIDSYIQTHSDNWSIKRMPVIDRNILRIAVFELYHCEDIPKRVSMNEAIELGKRFGTEKSSAFINGILDKVAREVSKE